MSRLRLFHRLIVRPFVGEPLRTTLIILAAALGVAVVLWRLSSLAARPRDRLALPSKRFTGNADLEVTAIGGVPDGVVGRPRWPLPFAIQVRPRIDDYAVVPATGQTVPLIGLDLVADHPDDLASADYNMSSGDALREARREDSVWVSDHLGAKTGDQLQLQINDRTAEYTVRGVLKDSGDSGSLVIMDIATAQRVLQRTGRVDRVLLKMPATASVEQWEQRIRPSLPADVELSSRGCLVTDENRRMLSAFRWNLRILSYVALVVGAFLIFNTISVSVVRRRPEIGIVRSSGASRIDVLAAFLGEAMCFGVAGGLLGIVLGRIMATGAVRLLGATVQNLYVSSRPG